MKRLLSAVIPAALALAITANGYAAGSSQHQVEELRGASQTAKWTRLGSNVSRWRLAANSATYFDPAGDNQSFAPDITNVAVVSTDGGGLGMSALTANEQYLLSGSFVGIFLDTDQNPATGNLGADFAVAISGASNTIALSRWNGATWDFSTPQSSLTGSWSYGPSLGLHMAELGSPTGFNFWIGSSWAGIYSTYYDFAPDAPGRWNFQVGAAPPPPPPEPS